MRIIAFEDEDLAGLLKGDKVPLLCIYVLKGDGQERNRSSNMWCVQGRTYLLERLDSQGHTEKRR
jgi:hypothetical protein